MLQLDYVVENERHKFQSLIDALVNAIDGGEIPAGGRMPSINHICKTYSLSQVTVSRAYMNLKNRGYISRIAGKGFYVNHKKSEQQHRILLVFNKLCYYKKVIYDGIVETLGHQARIELQIHHYNSKILAQILQERLASYDYFIVMPHFEYGADDREYLKAINSVPPEKLMLLDKQIPGINKKIRSIYQDFKQEAFDALNSVTDLLAKYDSIKVLITPDSNHPLEIVDGVREYCSLHNKVFDVISKLKNDDITAGTAFLMIEETELAELIKKVRNTRFKLGREIGIISMNETILKELLDITTFSTNFTRMGQIAAGMILNNEYNQIKNEHFVVRRKSL